MPRKSKSRLFGLFDEQAVSVLVVLMHQPTGFTELAKVTRLSKASLSRTLNALEYAATIQRTDRGYIETSRGRQVVRLILKMAKEDSVKATKKVARRLSELEMDFRLNHRIFHEDQKWERTAEKTLVEVLPMRHLTGAESLLFHQRFQDETFREEQRLRRARS